MKTKSIVKKYEKLSSEYGKAVTTLVETHQKYKDAPTEWNWNLFDEASNELTTARNQFYSFAEQEWR